MLSMYPQARCAALRGLGVTLHWRTIVPCIFDFPPAIAL